MSDIHVVILAAGKGTRMKSALPKVLHRVAGIPMLDHVLKTAAALKPQSVTAVVGHKADALTSHLAAQPGLRCVVQEPQLGTAHALLTAQPALATATGTLLVLSGDVPLLRAQTLKELIDRHLQTSARATIVTAVVKRPAGYGRVLRNGERIARIVEERDATADERAIGEINSGVYAFALGGLFEALRGVATSNVQREYYLPDLVAIHVNRGERVETLRVTDADEILGINNREDLEAVSRVLRSRKNNELMAAGVTIEDSPTTYIDPDVVVGVDTIIHPGVSLEGNTTIGRECEIHTGVRIVDSQIGDRVVIFNHCVITGSSVATEGRVGPFAHLRPGSDIRDGARVGNFVELKKTVLGAGSKSMHLAYLGDTLIGSKVNVGAGTITCNYDGEKKYPTVIEDGAFIGSDSQLVAPVKIGKDAYVGSGTTVRADVPGGALAVSAGKQRNIEDWAKKRKKT
jgi:bifunctional UDP-N-acetylglucosamine pyrophosphorylase / glucosamine-1-phosphate N-acetyltransferase